MAEKKDHFYWADRKIELLLETFTFPTFLSRLMLFTFCELFSKIALLRVFERTESIRFVLPIVPGRVDI